MKDAPFEYHELSHRQQNKLKRHRQEVVVVRGGRGVQVVPRRGTYLNKFIVVKGKVVEL